MYYGKMTKELKELYKEYEKNFGYSLEGEMGVEYGDCTYNDYVADIKKSIKSNTHIADLYPNDNEF